MRLSEGQAIIDKKSHELGESPRAVKAKKFSRFVMVVNPPQHLNLSHFYPLLSSQVVGSWPSSPRGLKFRSIQGVADRPVALRQRITERMFCTLFCE